MINTMFADSIVNATDLRKNQKRWLEKAYYEPITVNYGRKQLAIMNRDKVSKLYMANYYTEIVLKACQEFRDSNESSIFPWVAYLHDAEKAAFYNELLNCTIELIITGNWNELELLIEDWKATAEVERDPELVKVLMAEGDSSQYVEVED